MTTYKQYFVALKNTRDAICGVMGTLPGSLPADRRAYMNATLATVAIVVKVLVDKGLITDADLTAGRQAALGDVWDQEQSSP